MSYRDETRRALEAAVRNHPSIEVLVRFLRDPQADRDRKDQALLDLIRNHHASPACGAFAFLAAAMLPMLDHVYNARARGKSRDERDELWSRILAGFVEAVDRYPVERRPKRVAANLRGDTLASLRRATREEVRLGETRRALLDEEEPTTEHLETQVEAQEDVPDLDAILERWTREGLVSDADRALLVGVYVDGRPIASIAAELGIGREAAKKRLQRAVARIRNRT